MTLILTNFRFSYHETLTMTVILWDLLKKESQVQYVENKWARILLAVIRQFGLFPLMFERQTQRLLLNLTLFPINENNVKMWVGE